MRTIECNKTSFNFHKVKIASINPSNLLEKIGVVTDRIEREHSCSCTCSY